MRKFNVIVVNEHEEPVALAAPTPEVETPVVAHLVTGTLADETNVCSCGARFVGVVCPVGDPRAAVYAPTPAPHTLPPVTTEFLFAGRATFAAINPQGLVHTFRMTMSDSEWPIGSGKRHKTYFLNVKAPGGKRWPSGSQSPWRYIGVVSGGGAITTTGKSEYTSNDTVFVVAQWALRQIVSAATMPPGYQIHHLGRCGVCGQSLTDPADLARGIDADCYRRRM